MEPTPTELVYENFSYAYDFYNEKLFDDRLPACLITLQRKNGAYGYFSGDRFHSRDGKQITDEIALNPSHFRDRPITEILSTLVHEMVHLEQFHFGKPSRNGYHNSEWASLMKAVGLIPSDTGHPGGKETGQRVSHHVEQGGPFEIATNELTEDCFDFHFVEKINPNAKKKAASRTKYSCPSCGLNAWAKPGVSLICDQCEKNLLCVMRANDVFTSLV
jgi:predicted SprT family Zn-dependent metalloprotease